jgi:hypothetical protein
MIAASPWRDDHGTTRCPVCQEWFAPVGRQVYCSTRCRKTAHRRRHQTPRAAVEITAAQPVSEITLYECPGCGERLLGVQRCEDCQLFARRVDIGGSCPHCDQLVAISDLISQDMLTVFTAPRIPARRRGIR